MRCFRRAFLISVLGSCILSSTAFAAPGRLLDVGLDNGFPIAYAHADNVTKPRDLLLRVYSNYALPLEVRWQVTCAKKKKKVRARDGLTIRQPVATFKVKKGYKRPSNCTFDAIAAYFDADVVGNIRIELFYRPAKKTGKKGKKKKGRKSVAAPAGR
jgi:hypothetical protein